MRWWWFGPSVERRELDRELTAIAAAGFGGVEVSYVYPLGPVEHQLMSEGFRADLHFAAVRAAELGLRFDLTLGSGWSFGGPHISDDLAAQQLHWERREIGPSAMDVAVVSAWPGDSLVAAFIGAGSVQEPPEDCRELPVADGVIRIPTGQGPRQVLLAYARCTGQNVKRAAAGAEGPVLDHYSAAAAEQHIRAVAESLIEAVPAHLLGSVFCDSLEVYGADWTSNFLAEFEQRRSYDARPQLYRLIVDTEGSAQLRRDYYRTLTELYELNFVAVFQRWAAGHGVPFRIQGYGSPPAGVSSYRFADLFEGEGWGWKEITQTRWASSAAHLYSRDVVSSEVWTWVHSPSWRATPLDLLGEANEHFLAGINQLIGHGWPYSPARAPGLGWFFYAAGAINDRNPWWPVMPQLNAYLHRVSWLLRQGRPVRDVLVYLPSDDIYPTMGEQIGGSLDLWHETRRHIGGAIPRLIREAGLDFDLIDDDAIAVVAPQDAAVVILPFVTTVPAATRTWLEQVSAAGGSVIAVGGTWLDDTVAAIGQVGTVDELADILQRVCEPGVSLSPPSPTIGVLQRRTDDRRITFLANTGASEQSFQLSVQGGFSSYEVWDPRSGTVRGSGDASSVVELTLQPYESTVVVAFDGDTAVPTVAMPDLAAGRRRPLDGGWSVQFLDDPQPAPLPISLPHSWEADPGRAGYSGGAAYRTTFDADPSWFDGEPRPRVILDFGPPDTLDAPPAAASGIRGNSYRVNISPPIREAAVVLLNDVECGRLWAPPYSLDLTDHLAPGVNVLQVVIYNTAANALAEDSEIHRLVEESAAAFGRRFRMQDLDKALDSVGSGLLSVPRLAWGPVRQ
jgi:hypothetical protein